MYSPSLFLDSFFEQISLVGIDISTYNLDHVAYQASSAEDYDNLKIQFRELGDEVDEEIIGGRRVTVFRLHQPFTYKKYRIPALELIEPREGQTCTSAFQHAEFVIDQPFENYMKKYPNLKWDTSAMNRGEFAHLKLHFENGLTLKFLYQPILSMFKKK